ncbi:hypothetical protein APT58_02320 [Corynebacterium glutamicum]|nr:hypothetical protein APT58_02320 [Corynebacterium glutamicum]
MYLQTEKLAGFKYVNPFGNWIELDPFYKSVNQPFALASVIYGANGTGKSTLGKRLESPENLLEVRYVGRTVPHSPSLVSFSNVHVFNSNYIQSNLREEAEDVNTIVLLGGQVSDQSKIDEKTQERDTCLDALQALTEDAEKLESNISDLKQTINLALKSENGWASRQQRIMRLKRKSSVKEEVISELKDFCADFSANFENSGIEENRPRLDDSLLSNMLVGLSTRFEEKLADYIKMVSNEPDGWVPRHIELKFSRQEIENTLSSETYLATDKVNELTLILRKFEKSKDALARMSDYMAANTTHECQTCLKPLSAEYKALLVRIINDELKNLDQNESAKVAAQLRVDQEVELSRPEVVEFLPGEEEQITSIIIELNKLVQHVNNCLQDKVQRPSIAIPFDVSIWENIDSLQKELNDHYSRVYERVKQYNQGFETRMMQQDALEMLNYRISMLQVLSAAKDLAACEEALQKNVSAQFERQKQSNKLNKEINLLEAQKRSVQIAADEINKLLRIVFGEERISLKVEDRGYKVIGRGSQVPSGQLSTGEKNVLALCYFFVEIAQGRELHEKYGDEQLIVLDDPISSFDQDNKYGVHALIKHMSNQFLASSEKTRLLILTHDISVAFDIVKPLQGLLGNKVLSWEFDGTQLRALNLNDVDQYKNILRKMYDVGFNEEDASKISSNEVRRVYEAFCHFVLNGKVTEASDTSPVKVHFESMGVREREFLNRFMDRVFVHGGSHSQMDVVRFDYHLGADLLEREMRRFIREILCFIHILSPLHLPSNLKKKSEEQIAIKEEIDSYCDEILSCEFVG